MGWLRLWWGQVSAPGLLPTQAHSQDLPRYLPTSFSSRATFREGQEPSWSHSLGQRQEAGAEVVRLSRENHRVAVKCDSQTTGK